MLLIREVIEKAQGVFLLLMVLFRLSISLFTQLTANKNTIITYFAATTLLKSFIGMGEESLQTFGQHATKR